jgi:hypothetical protein
MGRAVRDGRIPVEEDAYVAEEQGPRRHCGADNVRGTTGLAVAVLKYRLYDIDLIIRKTAVYGVLTLLLALVYLGGVATLQRLLSPLVGRATSWPSSPRPSP